MKLLLGLLLAFSSSAWASDKHGGHEVEVGKFHLELVQLAPAGESLKGQAPFSVAKDAKIVVTFSVAGAKGEQGRFSLGQKQDHKGHKH